LNLDYLQVSLLAILQGFTEFLPISSSGHLLLPSLLLGWSDQGLTFDVAVHIGSLLAVVIYFRYDISRLSAACWQSLQTRKQSNDSRLAWLLMIATIPGGVIGLLLNSWIEQYARLVWLIAITSILFALLLLWSDRSAQKNRGLRDINWKSALLIGGAQALALIPGTSRSGITMTAALFCNLTRDAAARFSFLLSIPIILASGLLKSAELIAGSGDSVQWITLSYAAVVSGVVSFCCIHFFLRLIERIGFLPFVIYRLLLGTGLLLLYFN
jgi:undecaprenyl-diphosphatase